jgi:uncharacterized protein (TIGR02001 family)
MKGSTWFFPLVGAWLSLAEPASSQEVHPRVAFNGTVSVASDYTFRGISQTLEQIAIQGGITGSTPSGLYLGTWGSSLNFGEAAPTNRAQAEIDVFGGFKKSTSLADVDLGLLYYGYPGTGDTYEYDFLEVALGLSRAFGSASIGAKAAYSPDYFASSGSALYVSGSLGFAIPSSPFSLSAAIGHQTIETNMAFGTPDYTDFTLGGSVSTLGVSVGAAFVGTDLTDAECYGGSELCRKRFVVSLSRGM